MGIRRAQIEQQRQHKPFELGPKRCLDCGGDLEFLPTAILTTSFPHYRCVKCKMVWLSWGPKILGRCEDPQDHERDLSLSDQQQIIDRLDAEVRLEETEAREVGREMTWPQTTKAQRNSAYCKRWYRKHRTEHLARRAARYQAKKQAKKDAENSPKT